MSPQHPALLDEFHVVLGDDAVRRARERIADAAVGAGLPLSRSALADAKLCASETITNALLHAGGECRVRVEWTGWQLRVAIADRSVRLPSVLPATVGQTTGRGLALVDAFACSWGWESTQLGKVVHFLITADEAEPPAIAAQLAAA
ncbi:anti-sigma regulatory factor (Ser/Thr protein kinase) [Kitasatospora sp. MAA4]|uniref:ATP-binding protein n=1 Tax=Kitasatospora sp. MAA4 TaxID=3035093 RepID=UPI002474FF51|nr:ATP-binding protein [Kitasatospora sp. MAA4]MDH6133563.1 anti-sigma regulatory factor (Ser/Thr protein kinase) [Kitasatospora sp. MAA4]